MSHQDCRALKTLTTRKDVVYSISDKGGEFVVASKDFHREATLGHLKDTSIYEEITKTTYNEKLKKLQEKVNNVYAHWTEHNSQKL